MTFALADDKNPQIELTVCFCYAVYVWQLLFLQGHSHALKGTDAERYCNKQ